MALNTSPIQSSDFPDIIVQDTDTDATATNDVFGGAKSVHTFTLDNSQNANEAVYFKFFNSAGVTLANDVPDMKIKVPTSTSIDIIVADGLSFTAGVSFVCMQEIADGTGTDPSATVITTVIGS